MHLVSPSGPPKFMRIDKLGPLTKTKQGNRFVFVKTDWYSEITTAIPTGKVTAIAVATVFLEQRMVPYKIPNIALTNNGPQFLMKILTALCALLETRPVTTTE